MILARVLNNNFARIIRSRDRGIKRKKKKNRDISWREARKRPREIKSLWEERESLILVSRLFRLLHQFSSRRSSRWKLYGIRGLCLPLPRTAFHSAGAELNFQEEFHEVYQRPRQPARFKRHYHMNSQSQKLARRAWCNQLVISWKSRRPKRNQPAISWKSLLVTSLRLWPFLRDTWDDDHREERENWTFLR